MSFWFSRSVSTSFSGAITESNVISKTETSKSVFTLVSSQLHFAVETEDQDLSLLNKIFP